MKPAKAGCRAASECDECGRCPRDKDRTMQKSDFRGVFPAITTKMTANEEVDLAAVRADVAYQIDSGVDGVIVCGSLGEASSLTREEKLAIAKAAIAEAAGRKPILLTIAED